MVKENATQDAQNKQARRWVIAVFVILIPICILCIMLVANLLRAEHQTVICSSVPGWFSESDLIGTWVARGMSDRTTDTLIIDANGKYKQIIHTALSPVDYESDWQAWRIVRSDSGTPYLYLQGWRVNAACVSLSYNCDWVNDSGINMMDCCGDRPAQPEHGESVLTVLGPPSYLTPTGTRSTDLRLFVFMGCESSGWSYRFQEP